MPRDFVNILRNSILNQDGYDKLCNYILNPNTLIEEVFNLGDIHIYILGVEIFVILEFGIVGKDI